MRDKYVETFINSTTEILTSFGIEEIVSGNSYTKESFTCKYNLTTTIGLSGNVRGNIALSMPYDTAKKIASIMMMGMEITEIDEMSVSALGEMTNMICGQVLMELSSQNLSINVTPPTIIHGDEMEAYISQVETIVVDISFSIGSIELNIGLEM